MPAAFGYKLPSTRSLVERPQASGFASMPTLLLTVLAVGALGLFLMMPGGRSFWTRIGALLLAFAGVAVLSALGQKLGAAPWGWYLGFAAVMLFAAVRVITHSKPVYSALYFVLLVVSSAGLMIVMGVELLAYALVIVYAGAILVTYLFVIMLAQQAFPASYDTHAREPFWGCLAGFFLVALLATQLSLPAPAGPPANVAEALWAGMDNLTAVGTRLLTEYIIAIQIVGVLLLAAMVGAIAIARRQQPSEPSIGEAD
jgi:NADH-quinone oxidoreductase subunit J